MKKLGLVLIYCFVFPGTQVIAQESAPVEIIVNGKQPGPPMWRVKNGDNTLYIFAWLSPIPKNIFWESQKVEDIISEAQEYIEQPRANISVSPKILLNPINMVRGISLGRRISQNEDKASLEDVLPPELYARFSALKTQYFPGNKKIEKVRPYFAGQEMTVIIQKEAGLVPANDIRKKIDRMVKRNKNIKITAVRENMEIEGKFGEISNRLEEMMSSISREVELSCFERQISLMEENITEMQHRASTWAQGYIEEFKLIPLRGDNEDDCTYLMTSSSEKENFEEVLDNMRKHWLDASENALQNNTVTFAILDISQLLIENGLLAQLKARGYEVIEP